MPTPHVLVPTDFSAFAEQALDYAIRLARTLNARLTVLHVIQPIPLAGVDMGVALPATYLQEVEEAVQGSMEAALARVTAAGLTGERSSSMASPFRISWKPPRGDRWTSSSWAPMVVQGSSMCCWGVSRKRWFAWPRAPC